MRVLVIEDQRDIAANIWDYLERRNYLVDHAADGDSGLSLAMRNQADVIVLDLGLPGIDGLELCRRLRQAGRGVPVLMLTARDTLDDKLQGFAQGADDYMVKPFAMKELEARIQVLHRRGKPPADQPLRVGELSYDPKAMIAQRGERRSALTRAQAQILVTLMRSAPAIVTHAALFRAVWGEEGGDQAALHTHIYALRSLIDKGFEHPMIQSAHGMGYRLVATQ